MTTDNRDCTDDTDFSDLYAVRRIGAWEKKRFRYTDIHISITNGKIWIEEDMTEDGMATALLEQGIPKRDIVLVHLGVSKTVNQ